MIELKNMKMLLCARNTGEWIWNQRPSIFEKTMNGVESWVYALKGTYKNGLLLNSSDIHNYDLIILNMNIQYIAKYTDILKENKTRKSIIVGLFEGCLSDVIPVWKSWSSLANEMDFIISINNLGTKFLQTLTYTQIKYIGIPYPIEGISNYSIGLQEKEESCLLCSIPSLTPIDYLIGKQLGCKMIGFVKSFVSNIKGVSRNFSLDKLKYIKKTNKIYNDENLTLYPMGSMDSFLKVASKSKIWINLDSRYTWARYVLDAAALGIPIITTSSTGHANTLFPNTTIDNPFDTSRAVEIGLKLLKDKDYYKDVIEIAKEKLSWFSIEKTLKRLDMMLKGNNEN